MSDRFFLDTNIFVYSFDQSAVAKARKAVKLIRKALTTQKGIISYQVVQEFFNVALKRFSQPMTLTDAEQYLGTVFRPLLGVHSSQALYAEALHLQAQCRLSWYDSLIVSAAVQAQCDFICTEDLQHGQRFGSLRVANPFL
jgi:predicted nucleic acid-binding protein